jgi:hypothetical protein
MAHDPYWDGKIHKAVKFGDPFDPRTVEGRKRAMRGRYKLDVRRLRSRF